MPKEFMKERHTLEEYSPYGADNARFDAVLEPDKKQLTIIVRVQWAFPKRWNWLNLGFNSEATFKMRYREMVNQYWSGRYQILLAQPDGDDKKKPQPIDVTVVVAEGSGPHFTLSPQHMASGRSYVQGRDCVLYAGATKVKANDLLMRLGFKMAFGAFGSDRTIYEQARALELDQIPTEVGFKANTAELLDPNVGQEICDTLRDLHEMSLPMIPLRLKGFRLKGEEAGLSKARAEALANAIRLGKPPWQKGDKDNEPLILKDGGVQKAGAPPIVHIKVGGRRDVVKKVDLLKSVSAFPIAAHEFGHMIGLSDEYQAADAEARAQIRSANAIGIKIPEFAKNTASMMSMGDHFLPFHYITLREAVLKMIENYKQSVAGNKALVDSVPPSVTIGQTLLKKVVDFDRPEIFPEGIFKLPGGED